MSKKAKSESKTKSSDETTPRLTAEQPVVDTSALGTAASSSIAIDATEMAEGTLAASESPAEESTAEEPASEPPPEPAPEPNPAPLPGDILKAYRELAQVDAQRLASTLKVPVKKIEALEASDWSAFPDMVFTRSLVGSVCRYLKADPAPVLALMPGGLRATNATTGNVATNLARGKTSAVTPAALGAQAVSATAASPEGKSHSAAAGAAVDTKKSSLAGATPTQKIIQQTANSTSMGDQGEVPLRKRLFSPAVLLPVGLVAAAALVFFEPWAHLQSVPMATPAPQEAKAEAVVPTPQPSSNAAPTAAANSTAGAASGATPVLLAPNQVAAVSSASAAAPAAPAASATFNSAADAPAAPSKALLVVQATSAAKLEVLSLSGEKLTSRSLQAGETVSLNREGGAVVQLEPASGVQAWSQGRAIKLSPKAGETQLRFELPLKL